ncbi:hypothetical protein J8273_3885 [Carpediemonas membranifera]|uniref:Uncharacterized protein n=1 Tax=Carpediemonas membranifera TaxID=201153 RepID=A0A8J6E2Q9_9EUKA|nr:hypothetical protein J8273_3885 [Carpediemonas membranifera]|eukprot:KAG9394631.1 hypothetical protein J8273_3885 [Carpediemonas membranifera]
MGLELILDGHAWLIALPLSVLLGTAMMAFAYYVIDKYVYEGFFHEIFTSVHGYYVLIAIVQAHFLSNRFMPIGKPHTLREWLPALIGSSRHLFGAAAAIVAYTALRLIMTLLDIPKDHQGAGHSTAIVLGFFIAAFNDTCCDSFLDKWIKWPPFRIALWFPFLVAGWLAVYYLPIGIGNAMDDFNGTRWIGALAILQWVIVSNLITGLHLNQVWAEARQSEAFPFTPAAVALIRTALIIVCGVFAAFFAFTVARTTSPGATVEEAWHWVMALGTQPLITLITLSLYTPNFASVKPLSARVMVRLLIIAFGAAINFSIEHLVFNTGFLGASRDELYHRPTVALNFAISIMPLSHHWFSGRWGFILNRDPDLPVHAEPAAEEEAAKIEEEAADFVPAYPLCDSTPSLETNVDDKFGDVVVDESRPDSPKNELLEDDRE